MWFYENKEIKSIEDMPEDTYGFIYLVTHITTGQKYIGKKVLYFEINVKIGKREYEILKQERKEQGIGGRPSAKKKVTKESDWKTYYGSQKEIVNLVKEGKELDFEREILKFVTNKKLLTYYENKFLFSLGVIEGDNEYINDNIEGRYFRKDFIF